MRFYINIVEKSLAEQVEELEAVFDFVEALLADHERPADLLLLLRIGDDAHRVLLCDLREVADQGCPLEDFLRRAVTGEYRVLVEGEEGLERGTVERVEPDADLLEELHRALDI